MSYSDIESTIQDELIKLRPEFHKKINYPEIGEYAEGVIPQQAHDLLKNSVESDENTSKLFQLLLITKTSEISFTTSSEDDTSVFITDGTEKMGPPRIYFALPRRLFFPLDGDKSLDFHITKLINEMFNSVLNASDDNQIDDGDCDSVDKCAAEGDIVIDIDDVE